MDLKGFLARLDQLLAEREISADAAGPAVGRSRDLIRNWRRYLKKGGDFSPKTRDTEALASLLGVDHAWLITGRGSEEPAFREPIEPYIPPPSRAGTSLAYYLAPDGLHLETFRISQPAPWLGIMADDILIVDMKQTPKLGDIVLCAIVDENTDSANTRVLRYLPPYLVSGDPAEAPLQDVQARIQGPVVAMARGPGLRK